MRLNKTNQTILTKYGINFKGYYICPHKQSNIYKYLDGYVLCPMDENLRDCECCRKYYKNVAIIKANLEALEGVGNETSK